MQPKLKVDSTVTFYTVSHTIPLTDFEIVEMFSPQSIVTVLDYDEDIVGETPVYYWKVRVESEGEL